MATRDLTYLIDFNVEGAEDLSTAAGNMETLAEATNDVNETASLDLTLPDPTQIEDVGTAIGDLGADSGPIVDTAEKTGRLEGAFRTMVGAISLVEVGAAGADFIMGKIGERLDYIAETDAWDAGRVGAYADAIAEVGEGVEAIEDVIRTLADEPIQDTTGLLGLGGGSEIPNIAAALGVFGINAEEVMNVIRGGEDDLDNFEQRLDDVGASGSFGSQVMGVLAGEQAALATATAEAAAEATFFAESQESANRALQDLLQDRDPMAQFTAEWDLLRESMSDGSIDTTAAANALNTLTTGLSLTTEEVLALAQADLDEVAEGAQAFADAFNSIEFEAAELAGATSAFENFSAGLFEAGNETQRLEEAYADLAGAIGDGAVNLNTTTEAGREQQDALEQLSGVVETQLAEAYDAADGSLSTFLGTAGAIGVNTLSRLQADLNLTTEETTLLAQALGLTQGDYEARFALAGAEEARIQLDLLSGAIEGLPTEIEQTVTQQILAGDFVAARDTVANFYADNPVTLPTEVDESGADAAIQDKIIGTANQKTAIIATDADTTGADNQLDLVALEVRTATISAVADTASADAQLDAVVAAQRTATIDAVLGSIPTGSQIANAIGPVVVQIQGRWSTRIEGSRPV